MKMRLSAAALAIICRCRPRQPPAVRVRAPTLSLAISRSSLGCRRPAPEARQLWMAPSEGPQVGCAGLEQAVADFASEWAYSQEAFSRYR